MYTIHFVCAYIYIYIYIYIILNEHLLYLYIESTLANSDSIGLT